MFLNLRKNLNKLNTEIPNYVCYYVVLDVRSWIEDGLIAV